MSGLPALTQRVRQCIGDGSIIEPEPGIAKLPNELGRRGDMTLSRAMDNDAKRPRQPNAQRARGGARVLVVENGDGAHGPGSRKNSRFTSAQAPAENFGIDDCRVEGRAEPAFQRETRGIAFGSGQDLVRHLRGNNELLAATSQQVEPAHLRERDERRSIDHAHLTHG